MVRATFAERGVTTWLDIADKLDLMCCDNGPAGCRKKWGKKYHEWGRVDQVGIIHWSGWGRTAHRKGLYKVMLWAAFSKNRQFREEPEWLGLYHAALWAYDTAYKDLHIRFRRTENALTRQRVKYLMKRDGVLLKDHPTIRSWVNIPIAQDMLYSSPKRRSRDPVT